MSVSCTVDKSAIEKYYNGKAGFSFIPFIGDAIGDAALTKPPDHSSDLSNAQTQLTQTTTDILALSARYTIELQQDLISLQSILQGSDTSPGYVQATAQLTVEPLSEKVTLLSVQLVALIIVVLTIIFAGI